MKNEVLIKENKKLKQNQQKTTNLDHQEIYTLIDKFERFYEFEPKNDFKNEKIDQKSQILP